MSTPHKTVLFLTDADNALPREFALVGAGYGLEFFPGVTHTKTDWCVAWVCDDKGVSQAWLDHIPSAQCHFLGSDPEQAMRAACRLMSEWDKLEAAHEVLAVQ